MNISQTNKSLRPNDIFSIDDKMYMSLVGCDKFACINKKTDEIEFLKDNANGIHAYSYVSIGASEKYVVFCPMHGEKIAVFDTSTKEMMYIDLAKPLFKRKEAYRSTIKFKQAYVKDKMMFMFGYFYPAIICINLNSLEITYVKDWIDKVEQYILDGDDKGYFGDGIYEDGDYLTIPFGCCGALLKFNTVTFESEIVELNGVCAGFSSMLIDENYIWLQGRREEYGNIYRWNRLDETIIKIDAIENFDDTKDHFLPAWSMYEFDKELWLIPRVAKGIYKINRENMTVESVFKDVELQVGFNEYEEKITTFMSKQFKGKVVFTSIEGFIYILDLELQSIQKKEYTLSDNEYKNVLKNIFKYGIVLEYQQGLKDFLNYIV